MSDAKREFEKIFEQDMRVFIRNTAFLASNKAVEDGEKAAADILDKMSDRQKKLIKFLCECEAEPRGIVDFSVCQTDAKVSLGMFKKKPLNTAGLVLSIRIRFDPNSRYADMCILVDEECNMVDDMGIDYKVVSPNEFIGRIKDYVRRVAYSDQYLEKYKADLRYKLCGK